MYEITVEDVLDGFSTSASTSDLEAYIDVVDQADACLTANNVPETIGKQLKILGVRALAQSSEGGTVVEERAVSGASRKFAEGEGNQNSYLTTLEAIDKYGCVTSTISGSAGSSKVQLRSAGRRA